jgi:hypothetical protein
MTHHHNFVDYANRLFRPLVLFRFFASSSWSSYIPYTKEKIFIGFQRNMILLHTLQMYFPFVSIAYNSFLRVKETYPNHFVIGLL